MLVWKPVLSLMMRSHCWVGFIYFIMFRDIKFFPLFIIWKMSRLLITFENVYFVSWRAYHLNNQEYVSLNYLQTLWSEKTMHVNKIIWSDCPKFYISQTDRDFYTFRKHIKRITNINSISNFAKHIQNPIRIIMGLSSRESYKDNFVRLTITTLQLLNIYSYLKHVKENILKFNISDHGHFTRHFQNTVTIYHTCQIP